MDISKIIKECKYFPQKGYVGKIFKHMCTDIYFYLEIQLAKCMIRLNMWGGPVRTQMTGMQKMNNYEMSTQTIHNFHVCYSDKRKSKIINAD